MGYHTEFGGSISIEPSLNPKEIEYINKFNETRRMDRESGAYFVGGTGDFGQGQDADIRDHNRPPEGQPGLWCQWCVNEEGTEIQWDGGEKFYDAEVWMQYIIDHFLDKDPIAKRVNSHFDFLEGHTLNGVIDAEGEEQGDVWKLIVTDNVVSVKRANLSWD